IKPRFEKIAIKDAKLRTFITNDDDRSDMVTHVYDITYGTIRKGIDNLVVIDDSIVRGTTLKNSIIRMLDRLGPKKIIIVSSAPQIRYPDCYGIDMAKIGDLCAFKAAIALLEENNMEHIIEETYMHCKQQLELGVNEMKNYVRDLYKPFSPEQLSTKITSMLKPEDCKADVEIIFQKIEDLHTACPYNKGDWYFTGNYPTPGGNKVVSKAFINYMQGINTRAY
ncbi:MAG TPA: amidophosphoribosyltransferase, partial [Bacteroidia bacterium]|nr:amidophosphoribosyltransferase [Bacteroidia bacterium]